MAETVNISQFAEQISDDIFAEFGWLKIGPTNINWACENKELHKVETHPTDVVFFYDEPFAGIRTYLQTDLKSYAGASITKASLSKAITSLAMQVSCAEKSDTWRQKYAHDHTSYQIAGLLFIYNHDGGYDRSFSDTLELINFEKIDLPKNSKIYVLSPEDIYWLNNVSQEITRMRGTSGPERLPPRDRCSFFYPQPVARAFVRTDQYRSANVETLTGPWIIMNYERSDTERRHGSVIFYRGEERSVDDFLYLIDYMRQHEMLRTDNEVEVRFIDRLGVTGNNFQKARQQYAEQINQGNASEGLPKLVSEIKYRSIRNISSTFSEIEIGMSYDR